MILSPRTGACAHLLKPTACIPPVSPYRQPWTLCDNDVCQQRPISCNKRITLVGGVDNNGGGCVHAGPRGRFEISVPLLDFAVNLKASLREKQLGCTYIPGPRSPQRTFDPLLGRRAQLLVTSVSLSAAFVSSSSRLRTPTFCPAPLMCFPRLCL